MRHVKHSPNLVKAYVRILKKLSAPEPLIADFEHLISIDNGISDEGREFVDPIEDHFFTICLRHNFPSPYDKGDQPAYFRPNLVRGAGGDSGWGESLEDRLVEEQAYRRGFHQGFAEAKLLVEEGGKSQLLSREEEIQRWRFARIWFGATRPGHFEEWQISVRPIRSVSPKLRMSILTRDGFRCKICGDDAEAGARLEVDHIIPVSGGGSDDPVNLRTLCWACNAGKGSAMPHSDPSDQVGG